MYLQNARNERFRPPSVDETIRRLKQCQPAPLDWYRTRSLKMELLSAAEKSLDHDVIVTVVLFLKRTLSNPLFRQTLTANVSAADHYVAYLKEMGDNEELIDTL